MNKFKYSSASDLGNLRQNQRHNFAMKHSMMLYSKNALYSFIPKNACSTLRLSTAIENGCIDNIEKGHWIHANNGTFNATLGEAIKATYTFVILRCPYRRLASVYLDKFISKEPDAWQYRSTLGREVELDDLTFRDFVKSLQSPKIFNLNIHWRPQVDFLIYKKYSDYFCLENFDEIVTTLEREVNLKVVDARPLTKHETSRYKTISAKSFADTPAFDIATMKRNGECPSHASLYDDDVIDIIKNRYKADIALYTNKFGKEGLLFS